MYVYVQCTYLYLHKRRLYVCIGFLFFTNHPSAVLLSYTCTRINIQYSVRIHSTSDVYTRTSVYYYYNGLFDFQKINK